MSWRQWIRTVEIAPALVSADPVTMESQVDALPRTGCRVYNVREFYEAGARVLVVGAAIFEREALPRAYRRLVQALA